MSSPFTLKSPYQFIQTVVFLCSQELLVNLFKQPYLCSHISLRQSLQTTSLRSQKLLALIPSNSLSQLSKTTYTDPFKQPLSALKKSFFFQFPQTSSLRTQKLLAPIPLNNLSPFSKTTYIAPFKQPLSALKTLFFFSIPSNNLFLL